MPIAVLLITDRPEQSHKLDRLLSLWGRCAVVDLNRPVAKLPETRQLLISDVDLSSRASVEAMRRALASHKRTGVPHLCLVRDRSARTTVQANAIGASAVLPADVPVKVLLGEVGRMLNGGGGPEPVQQHFLSASAAVADMLASAARGELLPAAAIEEGVEAINRAADRRDRGAWLELVWDHDDATYQHCLLVAGLAAAFAQRIGFPEHARRLVTGAALLHDIGKARIPLAILHKPGPLTAEEQLIVREHPQIGYEMLCRQGGFAADIVDVARSHHEYLDGSGYPQGLRAGEISDLVRMITICDVYGALIERRSYRAPMAPEEAYRVLVTMVGKLDADLVRVFRQVALPN